jgi:hypothetical protein
VFSRAGSVVSLWRRSLPLALLLFLVGCSRPAGPLAEIASPSEWHTFSGTWTSSGTRQTLKLERDHRASIFDLTGSLVLMQGRCVWTDERGDKIYSELKGEWVGTGRSITGTFLGGTGRFAGITGEYSFEWKYVIESDDGGVSGSSINLQGRARFGSASAALGEAQSKRVQP